MLDLIGHLDHHPLLQQFHHHPQQQSLQKSVLQIQIAVASRYAAAKNVWMSNAQQTRIAQGAKDALEIVVYPVDLGLMDVIVKVSEYLLCLIGLYF